MFKQTIKEWLTVWLFVTIIAVGLFTVAVLMPFFAVYDLITYIKERRLFENKQEKI
tara:strand:+ start:978 stop:1145 length:168 start_codon:yes stop_codon:yes gene_type:complete